VHLNFEHVNLKHMHALQSMVSDTNLGKILCHTYRQYVKNALRDNNLRWSFPIHGKASK
jgi:hypothetical protein